MEMMEILKVLLLFMLAIEGALIIYDKKPEEKPKEERTSTRRDVYGSFGDPLGDSYRRNTRRQYVPIIPNSKMLDGDDDE